MITMRITRRQLRYLIKEMAAKQPSELSDSFHWEVIKWSARASDEEEWDGWDGEQIVNNIFVAGYVHTEGSGEPSRAASILIKQKPESDCKHWEVKSASVGVHSDVSSDDLVDLGPMMYDIAMELAGDDGMISDSGGTSEAAQGVWNFYLLNRSGVDVELYDMDPGLCGRGDISGFTFPRDDYKFKVYRKRAGSPSIIKKLESLGKIRF